MAFERANVEQIKVAVVMGSVRDGRLCDTITAWLMAGMEGRCEFAVQVIDPAELPLPGWAGLEEGPGTTELRRRLAEADAFIVVTPEYNHSFTAALKTVIDTACEEWHAKPVGFISYGGISGGLRAVEQLRQVFAELHAVTLRDCVSFASAWDQFDQQGQLKHADAPQKSLNRMLATLHWWASALRNARQQRAYGQVA